VSERVYSGTAATRRGVHDRLAELPVGRPPDYDPGRTLPLRTELVRQLKRRRTQVVGLLLIVLPIIMAIAFEVGGSGDNTGDGGALVSVATTGAANFALFAEFASVGFLLVVVVSLFCGDTVASEASWASLRYLLAQPVPRSRLLRQKLIIGGVLSAVANLVLPVWAYMVGGLFFGWAPATSPLGTTFSTGQSVWRLLIVVAYVCGQLLIVAALAFLLSVTVDNPLGAVGGAVMPNIIDQITALGTYRHYLPTHWQYSWTDVLQTPISWDDMIRGTGCALIYTAIFLAVAWLRFDRKDITS
jgi:ABC-2 type transport system permease protein